jgi:hypothetical protein
MDRDRPRWSERPKTLTNSLNSINKRGCPCAHASASVYPVRRQSPKQRYISGLLPEVYNADRSASSGSLAVSCMPAVAMDSRSVSATAPGGEGQAYP